MLFMHDVTVKNIRVDNVLKNMYLLGRLKFSFSSKNEFEKPVHMHKRFSISPKKKSPADCNL